jgi:hypothetical protein
MGSKVIRIPEEVFFRLQNQAKPLVDTPGSVISRLLDYYEEHAEGASKSEEVNPMYATQLRVREPQTSTPNLFLAPATKENVKATIEGSVSLEEAARYVRADQLASLQRALGDKITFRCWAMTEGSRTYFQNMRRSDIVLLTVKSSGRFEYKGTILTKLESASLGNALWSETQDKPWELIYVFEDVKKINIRKSQLVSELGYQPGYVVPGVIRVDPVRVLRARGQGGTVDDVFDD